MEINDILSSEFIDIIYEMYMVFYLYVVVYHEITVRPSFHELYADYVTSMSK